MTNLKTISEVQARPILTRRILINPALDWIQCAKHLELEGNNLLKILSPMNWIKIQ